MEAMRAIFKTIRDRLRPSRRRQRTKNYRICRNSAMAKIKPCQERNLKKQLTSELNTKKTKAVNGKTANLDTADSERRVQEDGAPGELNERLKYSLWAFQERPKPHWVLQRGWGQNTMDDLNMDTLAEEDLQPAESANERANMEETLAVEDLQSAEPASWLVAYGQMWWEITDQDGPVLCSNMPIIYSGPGSSYHFPAEWGLDHLIA
ncbi:uncharacterized protein LOC121715283 [Alosa sapidissima]|uniref:uncharacterized protein LOC121715283 n=1 Tax=Alosa sapidissima TaxID=34773 RepID=UPI001C07FC23|nr:uncharacterized protein LOC121715283 [Alosa sapidissima]